MVFCVSVYTVVTYLKNEMNRGDFFMTLRNQPVALSLYRQVIWSKAASDKVMFSLMLVGRITQKN